MTRWSDVVNAALELQGAEGAALVNLESGSCMAFAERADTECLSLAAVVNARMLRALMRLASDQMSSECLDDVLITFGHQYHLVRPVRNSTGIPSMFFYVVVNRNYANLAMTRRKMAELEEQIAQLAPSERPEEMQRRNSKEADLSELPPFMREDQVMRLLGLAPAGSSITTSAGTRSAAAVPAMAA